MTTFRSTERRLTNIIEMSIFQNDVCHRSGSLQAGGSQIFSGMYRNLFGGRPCLGGDLVGLCSRHTAAERVFDIPGLEVLRKGRQQFVKEAVSIHADSSPSVNDLNVY
jgi:hypothetical protein